MTITTVSNPPTAADVTRFGANIQTEESRINNPNPDMVMSPGGVVRPNVAKQVADFQAAINAANATAITLAAAQSASAAAASATGAGTSATAASTSASAAAASASASATSATAAAASATNAQTGVPNRGSAKWTNVAALPAFTYANGSSGVGATMTASANGVFPSATADGQTVALNDRFWHRDPTGGNGTNIAYGLWQMSQLGTASAPWIATRVTDADAGNVLGFACALVTAGAQFAGYAFRVTNDPSVTTTGTTAISVVASSNSAGVAGEAAARVAAVSAEAAARIAGDAAINTALTPITSVLSVIASGVASFGRTWVDTKGRLAGWIDTANNWTIVKLVALRASIAALAITGSLTIGALVQSVATTSFLRSVVDLKGRLLMALQADGSILISKLRDGTNTDVYAKLATAYTAALAATPPSSYKAALSAAFQYGFYPTNMASPPTITTAVTTQTITGGTTTPWQSSFWRTLYGKYVQAGGNAYGQFLSANYSSTVNGPATASNNAAVEFMHTGTAFEIVVYGNGQPLALMVGPDASTPRTLQRANTTPILNPNNTGQAVFIRVDFGTTSATRRIRIEGPGLIFGGVVCKAGETVSAVTDPKPPIVVWMGDSFVEGGTGTVLPGTGMTMHTARALGWDIWSSGVGGTGVIQPLAPRLNFQGRMADAYSVSGIQLLIFSNSINDSGQTQAALQAGIENCMTQFRAVCPNVPVIMTSIQTVNGTLNTNYFYLRDAAAQVAREFPGVYYLDRLIRNVMTGTGSIPYPPPSALAVTTSGTTGGPAAATYYYVVTAKDSIGETTASNEVSIASNGGPNALTWTGFGGLTYSVYRGTSAGGESVRLASGLTSAAFTDTGAAATSAAPPTVNTTGNKGDGNSDLYRNYDQTHPSPAGHQYRGLDDSNEIRGVVSRIP